MTRSTPSAVGCRRSAWTSRSRSKAWTGCWDCPTYSTFGRGIEEFHNGYRYLDLTALGRQEAWEEPKGRAVPLGLHVGGPAMRLLDEYDD